MPAALGKQRTDCTGRWVTTLGSSGRQAGAVESLWWVGAVPSQHRAQHSQVSKHHLGRMKEAKEGGSSLKHGKHSTASDVSCVPLSPT